jgi:hypothetical protein
VPSPNQAFSGVVAATDAQKAALGQMIAAQGSAGVDAYKAQQKVAQAAIAPARASVTSSNPGIGDPSASSAVGPGRLTQMLAARSAQPATLGAFQGGQAANEFGQYSSLIGQANNNYMDAVKGAAPIVQSQTDAQIAALNAEAAAKLRDRQQAADDAASSRDWERIQHQWAIEDRMLQEADYKRKLAEQGQTDATPYGSSAAAHSLGWNPDKLRKVTQGTGYSSIYQSVTKNLQAMGPGVDNNQVRAVIQGVINQYRSDPQHPHIGASPKDIEDLIAYQYRGLLGQNLPAYQAPPPNQRAASAASRAQQVVSDFLAGGKKKSGGGKAAGTIPASHKSERLAAKLKLMTRQELANYVAAQRTGTVERTLGEAELRSRPRGS